MPFTAIFVDLDGTLADSMPVLYRVYSDFMASMGKEGSREEFQSLMGPSMPEVLGHIRGKHGIEEDLPVLLEKYLGHLAKHYQEGIPLFPGAREFLEQWNRELSLALVTSAPSQLASFFLRQHGLEAFFTAIFTGEMVPKLKPEPDIYLHALEKTGFEPNSVVAIEDSPAGVTAAQRAGLTPIMLAHHTDGGVDSCPEGIKVATSWAEVTEVLNGWR